MVSLGHGERSSRLMVELTISKTSCEYEQDATGHLECIRETSRSQGPAEGHVYVGEQFSTHQLLQLVQGLLRVADVDAHTRECKETCGKKKKSFLDLSIFSNMDIMFAY